MRTTRTCSVEGCDSKVVAHGRCSKHAQRFRRNGTTDQVRLTGLSGRERIRRRSVESPTGCWEWQGFTQRGYGRLSFGGRLVLAHRLAYEEWVGPIAPGFTLDHLCRNRGCVNPAHLEPVTSIENCRRSPVWCGNRTHCPQGHAYDGDNLLIEQSTGRRRCVICARETKRRWKARRRASRS